MAVCAWLLSLSMMFSRSLYHILLPNNSTLYGYTTICLSIHKVMTILHCFHFCLLWIMLLYIFVYKLLCKYILKKLLSINLGIELLVHMETRFKFWGTATFFFPMQSHNFTFPLVMHEISNFSIASLTLVIVPLSLFFNIFTLKGMKWYFTLVLIYISLMTNEFG